MCNRNFNRLAAKSVQGFLSWEIFSKVRPFFKYARRVDFSGFGEPLLHPDYVPMLREIKKSKSYVYLFTNGLLLTEEIGRNLVDAGTDMLSVSIGGATRETYKRIRGVDGLDKVAYNIQTLNEYKKRTGKKKPILSFNIVIMNSFLSELEDIVKLAYKIGVENIAFPNLYVQGESMQEESIWHNKEKAELAFQKARELANGFKIQISTPILETRVLTCNELFKRLFITWDGKVLSCPLERFLLGDLDKSSVSKIWNGRGALRLRKDYYTKGSQVLCPNCPSWDYCPDAFLHPWFNSREFAKGVN
jgi:radical SAM protein with 4Fe4S-binding SPASM domain